MSQLDEVRQGITERVKNALAASLYSAVPLYYPNGKFIQPDNTMWAMLSIIGGEGVQANLGPNATERHIGQIQFDVLVPEDSGTKVGNDFGEFLGNVFKMKQFSVGANNTVVTKVPSFTWVGRTEKGLSRLIIRIPFRRDSKQ